MSPTAGATVVDFTATPKCGWELFPHDADIGVHSFGPRKEAAFELAALAHTAAITDPCEVSLRTVVEISCQARNSKFLLVECSQGGDHDP